MSCQSYSEIYGLQEQMGVTEFSRMARLKSELQELTESIENENATSLNYWQCKFVQELQIIRVDDIPLGRSTILSAA